MLKKMIIVVVCVLLMPAGIEVGVTHGLDRVGLYDPVPLKKEVSIQMAQNEYEPFQIVLSGEGEVTVAVSDLYSGEGYHFSRENFSFYAVHYIYVNEPSPRSRYGPDWYPDGLVPFEKIHVHQGENAVVWVDVYAPVDQKPGVYTGVITVDAGTVLEIPITVEVWHFQLPEKTSLKSGVEVMVEYVIDAHDLSWEPEELEPALYDYYETLIEHRVMPLELYFAEPDVSRDGSIDMTENHEHLKYFMDVLQVNCLMYPMYEDWPFRDPFGRDLEKTTKYLQELYQYYVENGWEDRFYFYIIDEPNSKKAYEEVRDVSRKLKEIEPAIPFMVTEQIVPDDEDWGDLRGYVDVWCPLFPCIEDEKMFITERQQLGEEVWTYTALTQGEKETPFWEIDFPVLNYRVVTWMIWNSDITGLVYWACNWWDVKDPWEDTETWIDDGDVYNGEGVLVYPGEKGCLPSLRLKVLREGMEDYEYFVLLKSLGKESFVDGQVKRIVKSWYKWDENPDRLLDIRRILGEEINRVTTGADVSQEPQEEIEEEEKIEEDKKEIEEDKEKEYLEEDGESEQILVYGVIAVVALLLLALFIKRR